jgi:phage shock protein A
MGLWERTKTLFKARANALISKAEKPEEILEQAIVDMKRQFVEARKQVAAAMADEKRLATSVEQERRVALEWQEKAVLAVKAGRDDLGREALVRYNEHAQLAVEYEKQLTAQSAMTEKVKTSLQDLNRKIDEASRRKNLLVARARRAEAQKSIQDTMSGMSDTSAFDTFQRMEKKVDQLEAEADASEQLGGELSGGDQLSKDFKELEAGARTDLADRQLAELKARMAALPK